MPSYDLNVILQSDTDATGDSDFRNGSWTFNGNITTLTINDEDNLGLGDNDPNTETGAPATVTAVDGDTTHPLVGTEIFAKYVRSDDGDGDTDTGADVVFLGTGVGFNNFAIAAYPGSGWSMEAGDTYVGGGMPGNHAGGGSWSTEAQLDDAGTNAPCFVSGMEIRTIRGPVAVEKLVPGDMIWTLDNGFQELLLLGRRKVKAQGSMAPVMFKKGIIGNTKDIMVSPRHRFHVGSLPDALKQQFGDKSDSLLQALAFCNGTSVRQYPDIGEVEYFHLMFEDHQLVECHGTISESWQPTRKAIQQSPDQADELLAIFPELLTRTAAHPGAIARHEIKLKRRQQITKAAS